MSYGWAIVIIMVVVAALSILGVFNPLTFAPKASPGSCQLTRPFGAGTTVQLDLSGTCNNQIPKYVASFTKIDSQNINTGQVLISSSVTQFTISLWMYVPSSMTFSGDQMLAGEGGSGGNGVGALALGSNEVYFGYECNGNNGGVPIKTDTWYHVVGVYGSGFGTTYVNGINSTHGSFNLGPNQNFTIGNGGVGCNASPQPFGGYISNVQVYDSALSEADVRALYNEGIGGAPIDLKDLVAWYPLNGDTYDYSGNKYHGSQLNVTYTNAWYNDYKQPSINVN